MNDITSANNKNVTEILLKLSGSMLLYDNQDDYFANALHEIGNAIDVHRAYIFELNGKSWNNTFSWVNPTLPAFVDLMDGSGQYITDALYADGLYEALTAGKAYVMGSVDKFDENARNILQSQGIINLIMVPLFSNGKLTSFFGVDLCAQVDNWAEDILSTIVTIGYLLNNGIHYFNSLHVLRKKDEEAQALLDILPFPIFITDPTTYKILCYNTSLNEYADLSDIDTTTCYKKLHGRDTPCEHCSANKLAPGESRSYDLIGYKGQKDFKMINVCIPWDDLENAALTIALDITDSLRLQREQVLDRESSIAKSRFLANMSHELRTPLNGIIGMTHLAIQNNKDRKVGNYLARIQESSGNLLHVINDILDFSKIEAEKLELEQQPFSPLEVFVLVKEQLLENARHKDILLEYSIGSDVSKLLIGDALRLSQVTHQLVKNAIKFTEEDGHIKYSLSLHEKRPENNSEVLCLTVEDTGIGISEENLKKLFVGFSQADTSSTRRYGGTGLGLAIVEGLLELMGGSISVKSTVGEGTTFTCLIPFMVATETTDIIEKRTVSVDIKGVNILLAEDNDINSLIAYEMLNQMGCNVDCVQDGQEALNAVDKKAYDIVLMDVQMPLMDGLEAAEHIRKNEKYDSLPIIALTAHTLTEEIEKCYKAGMQCHVLKPISADILCNAIADYVKSDFKFER